MIDTTNIDQDTLKVLTPWIELGNLLINGPFNNIPPIDEEQVSKFMMKAEIHPRLKFLYVDSPMELLLAEHYLELCNITKDEKSYKKYEKYYYGNSSEIDLHITSFEKRNKLNFKLAIEGIRDTNLLRTISDVFKYDEPEAGDGQQFRKADEENPDIDDSEENRINILRKINEQIPFKDDHPEAEKDFLQTRIYYRGDYTAQNPVNNFEKISTAAQADVFLYKYHDTIEDNVKSDFHQFIEFCKNPIFEMYFFSDKNTDVIYLLISKFPKKVVYSKEIRPTGRISKLSYLHNSETFAVEFVDGWSCYFIYGHYLNKYQFTNFITIQPSADDINKMRYLDQHYWLLPILREYYGYREIDPIEFDLDQIRKWFSSEEAEFWYTYSDEWVLSQEEYDNYQ